MFDFPQSPASGTEVVNGGARYRYDGVKWVAVGGAAAYVAKAGDVMTGALTLPGNASSALQAVPLQQVTAQISAAPFVHLAGDTMTGALNVSGADVVTTNNVYAGQGRFARVDMYGTDNDGGIHFGPGATRRLVWQAGDNNLVYYRDDGAWLMQCTNDGTVLAYNITSQGDVRAGSRLYCNDMMNTGGVFYVGGNYNYYLSRNPNNGDWNFVENGTVNLTIAGNGDTFARNTVYALQYYSRTRVYVADTWNVFFGPGGAGITVQFGSNWYLEWNNSNGNLVWVRNGPVNWVMNCDSHCYNNESWVGGRGAYQDFSDERHKEHIEPSSYGLDEILALKPIRFRRKPMRKDEKPDPEVGFSAQDVQRVLPEAVREMEMFPTNSQSGEMALSMATTPIVAALVNAVQELTARVKQLEAT